MKRKVVAYGIILASAVFAVVILLSPEKIPVPFFSAQADPGGDSALRFNRVLPTQVASTLSDTDAQDTGNFTKDFARFYAEKLKKTPGALQTINGKLQPGAIPSDDIAQALSTQIAREHIDVKIYEMGDIRVGTSDTKEDQLKYLRALAESWSARTTTLPLPELLNRWATKNDTRSLEQYVADGLAQITRLLTLSVPPSWKIFHLENLNLWQKKIAILQTMLNISDDPVKTLVALKELQTVSDKNTDLQKVLEKQFIVLQFS